VPAVSQSPLLSAVTLAFVASAAACGVTVAPADGDRDGSVPDATPRDSDVTAQADSEAAVVPVVGPTSLVTIARFPTATSTEETGMTVNLFAQDAEGRVIREEVLGACTFRTYLRSEYVSVGPIDVFVRDLRSTVAPAAPSGAYVASWTGSEQPSENDVVRVDSGSDVNFPRFALSARFPGRLTVLAPRGLPARLPYPVSGSMSFAWDPPRDASLMVHVLIGSSPVLSCFVPAASGRFDVPRAALDLFRGARPTTGRVGLARVSDVQVGNRLIRYRLEHAAYKFNLD
jgi:hypothetical protein